MSACRASLARPILDHIFKLFLGSLIPWSGGLAVCPPKITKLYKKLTKPHKYKKITQKGVGSMQGSNEGCLPTMVVFHQRLCFTEGCLPPKVVFHQRLSSNKGCLPRKVIFHLSLQQKVIFHRRSSSPEGR